MEIGLTIYEALAPLLMAAIGWVSVKLANFIKAKTKNEMMAGVLIRLNESVTDAVKAVNQQMVEIIGRAKDPNSPGGKKITTDEALKLHDAAKAFVRSYWGEKGLKELAYVLGFGSLFGKIDEQGLNNMLTTKIEAAVNEEKKNP